MANSNSCYWSRPWSILNPPNKPASTPTSKSLILAVTVLVVLCTVVIRITSLVLVLVRLVKPSALITYRQARKHSRAEQAATGQDDHTDHLVQCECGDKHQSSSQEAPLVATHMGSP